MLVVLCGATNSGKSTVAAAVAAARPHTVVVAQDDFYRAVDAVPMVTYSSAGEAGPCTVPDWDCAGALDTARLTADVAARMADPAAYCPTCTTGGGHDARLAHVVLVEGTLVNDRAVLPISPTVSIMLATAADLCRARRRARA